MNRTLLSAALLLSLAAPAAFAQTAATQNTTQTPAQTKKHFGRHHRNNPHRAAERMSKKLNLSADQTAKLEPIMADRQQKMKALHADTSLSADQKKAQRKQIMQDSQTQLASVLTPEQLQQMKSARKGNHHRRGGTPAPAAAPANPQ